MQLVTSSLSISVESNQPNVSYFVYQELMASGRHGSPCNEPEGPEEVIGTLREMAATMREQATVAHYMMEQMNRRSEENLDVHTSGAEVGLEYLKFAKFWKANPPSFKRVYNLDQVNE